MFVYFPGKDNAIADCFSWLLQMEKPSEGKSPNKGKLIAFDKLQVSVDPEDEIYKFEDNVLVKENDLIMPPTEAEFNSTFRCQFSCCRDGDIHEHLTIDDIEMEESFLNPPPLQTMPNPITMPNIQQHQTQDQLLMQQAQRDAQHYQITTIDERLIITYQIDPARQDDWRIYLPLSLVDDVITWYHLVLGHRGKTSMYATIAKRFYSPGLKQQIERFNCEICQLNKAANVQYGQLPERHTDLVPWFSVAVDLIGPWKIDVNGRELEFNALTCIDPVTNLTELAFIENKTATHVASVFEMLWLSRYPRPYKCIHDQGGEFIGEAFQAKLATWGIHDGGTTSKNATANAICERMHLTVANILRTRYNNAAPNFQVAVEEVKRALAACNHAMRCAVSTALMNNTPGETVFHRDMLLNIPVIVDLLSMQQKRQYKINENLRRQNAKRKEFDYRIGGEVLIKNTDGRKLEVRILLQMFTLMVQWKFSAQMRSVRGSTSDGLCRSVESNGRYTCIAHCVKNHL
ncbi:unnamed protein product [Cylindrotheca closterium]|uniref:Integrase catalytic domain-containing protein n=1 Tax=Cylindrotheca closterium TaxID=2856 RepID=A0AAD2G6L5_9STRA|nr:unnamed protein product [Cylindrotheca closterium]